MEQGHSGGSRVRVKLTPIPDGIGKRYSDFPVLTLNRCHFGDLAINVKVDRWNLGRLEGVL